MLDVSSGLRFREMNWPADDLLEVGGARFRLTLQDFKKKTDENEIVLLKNRGIIEWYRDLLQGEPVRNILDIGVFQGGSPIFFGVATDAGRVLGIERRRTPPQALAGHLAALGLNDRVRFAFGVSQDDRAALNQAIDRELDGRIDLAIDDASHQYWPSRASFETVFPRLSVGSCYIIEDWSWAHWRNYRPSLKFRRRPAPSNLIFEICMAIGAGFPATMKVESWCAVIRKTGEVAAPLDLGEHAFMGPKLIGKRRLSRI